MAECTTDEHCASKLSCLQEKCKDPCVAIAPCARNAECTVHNSLPLRTMSCSCIPGYTGKGDEYCNKISELEIHTIAVFFPLLLKALQKPSFYLVIPEPVGCTSDSECSPNQACDNGNCVNPCVVSNPCSSTAACYVSNHAARCKCPPGFTGDPYSRRVQSE